MSNMFSGKVKKPVPQSLAACTTPDPTPTNLHIWSERLETWGRVIFFLLVTVGAIVSFMSAFGAAAASYKSEGSAFMGTFILSALSFALAAFIGYCTFHILALLLSALACIAQNTIISANVALFSAYREFGADDSILEEVPEALAEETQTSDWVCKSCGQHNKKTASFCVACGKDR